jgi:tetraacyldisaccharide 4'-kinase
LSGTATSEDGQLQLSGDYWRALVNGRRRGPGPRFERLGLWTASVPYGWVCGLRNRLYDRGWKASHRAAVPVVSVGNLTVGGTGKTPCVEYVARFYRDHNKRVTILSRGYGGAGAPNDEALVLDENLRGVPHLQGIDRVALAARAVREEKADVLVLDDGFQHRRLARDLDVVLVDATEPWGWGYLFPRGLLREAPSGLRRAGVVVLTRCDQVSLSERGRLREVVDRLAPGVPVVEATHRPTELVNSERESASLQKLAGRLVVGFCGIGNPDAFRRTLEKLELSVGDFRTFPDHHRYTPADITDLETWAGRQAKDCVVVTTQKDLVKVRLPRLAGKELWALRVRLCVESGQDALDRKLKEALG